VAAWLGGDAGLVFAPARGVNRLGGESMRELSISHPIVRDDQRRTVLRDAYVMRFGHLVFDGEVWPDPSRGVALLPTLVDESGADWLLVDRSGTARNVHLPPFGDAFTIGWSPSAERFAWKWFPWPSSGASKSRRFAPLRIVLLDRDQSMRTIEVAGTTSYDTQVAWVDERTLLVTEYESGGLQRGWWRTLDADTAILSGRIELPEGLGLAAPALQQQFGGGRASRLPTLGVEPVALLTDRAALNLWYRPEEGVATPPRLLRLEVRDQALIAGRELPARSLASTLGNADDGSLVWAAPERAPRLPHWDGGSRSQIFRLRSFDAQTEPVCEVASGRLFRYLGQHRDWLVWSTPEFRHEFELWGCNLATGESRRLSEWEPWANPTVAIAEAGIFTPRGWMPLAAEAR
jgi:hypothetical protein